MAKKGTNHMMRALALLFGMSCLLLADDEVKQKVKVTHTERVDFPSGGRLRVRNSIGELTVEGWERPDVEITTIKSTKAAYASRDREKASRELEKVRISAEPCDLEAVSELQHLCGGNTRNTFQRRVLGSQVARIMEIISRRRAEADDRQGSSVGLSCAFAGKRDECGGRDGVWRSSLGTRGGDADHAGIF